MPSNRRPKSRENNRAALYAGRWIARIGDRIIAQGGTPQQAYQAARAARFKENPKVVYIPMARHLSFSPLLEQISAILPPDQEVYLVGGAVRDALLGHETHDIDFVLSTDVLNIARRVANQIGAAFFVLDPERYTARLVLENTDGSRQVVDFTAMRGPDLESDLRARDFTINAMAVDVRQPQALLDPLGGMQDLLAKHLRACSPSSFEDDPLRILRAIRFAAALNMHILPETRGLMREVVGNLGQVSPERLRDELFRILDGPRPATSLRALDILNAVPFVLPELASLKGVEQSPPHEWDVWKHTLNVVEKLEEILNALSYHYDPDTSANLALGVLVLRLGRYREQVSAHLRQLLNPDRTLRNLLFFAALYHDIGKPVTKSLDEDGRIRFLGHEPAGAKIVKERAQNLRLNNVEVERLVTIVHNHLRPKFLVQAGTLPSPRAVYRFFRDTGPAGIEICLLSLADTMATYGHTLSPEVWQKHLDVIRKLMEAWWETPAEHVLPPQLVDGHALMERFNLKTGPIIGELLEIVREAQVAGEISTPEEALSLIHKHLERNG